MIVHDQPVMRQQHEQLLKLVAKSFYRELVNYGVNEAEVLAVAGHLLDNVMQRNGPNDNGTGFYNGLFTINNLKDDWRDGRRLAVQEVSISPLDLRLVRQISLWLRAPAIRESFCPKFP